ncbi:MAG: hypothetical protein COX57_09900, partial [Alphaproteobacteria bacterium CG_4_10_14_0_2_um_filter_63_37]
MAVNNGWLNRCRGAVVAVLATLPLLLASCGDTPLGPSGTVVVVSPYTPAPAGGAIVSQTPPADLASLVIEVRDSANAVLAGPITVIPGQPAQLEVESGEGRILLLQGLDSAGDAIYSGTSAPFSLQPDETKPVALDVYGAMLKGSTTLTSGASLSVYGDGQTTPVASSSVAADGSFKIILPPKTLRPYLLVARSGGNVVGTSISDAPGSIALSPVSSFLAAALANPLAGQSTATQPTLADVTTAWAAWSAGNTQQATQFDSANTNLNAALGLSKIGISALRLNQQQPQSLRDLIDTNGLVLNWQGGIPFLTTAVGVDIAASTSTGNITLLPGILVIPAANLSSGVTVANRTAASGEWLMFNPGSASAPLAITLPASLSGQSAANIAAGLQVLGAMMTSAGIDPAAGGTTFAQYLATALEQVVAVVTDPVALQALTTQYTTTFSDPAFTPATPAPTAFALSVTTTEDTALNGTLSWMSDSGAMPTLNIVAQPQHGTISLSGDTFTYQPSSNYNGSDFFTYQASNSNGTSTAARVDLTITPVNDPPVPTATGIAVVRGGSGSTTVLPNDPDTGDSHTYAISAAPTHGSASVSASGVVTLTAANNYAGSDSLVVTVTDAAGASAPVTIPLTLSDATGPVVNAPTSITVAALNEAGTPANDPAIAAFLVGASANDPVDGLVPTANDAPTTFPLGTRVVTFTAVNAVGGSGSATATVTVTDQAAPVVTAPAAVTVEATGVSTTATLGTATAND